VRTPGARARCGGSRTTSGRLWTTPEYVIFCQSLVLPHELYECLLFAQSASSRLLRRRRTKTIAYFQSSCTVMMQENKCCCAQGCLCITQSLLLPWSFSRFQVEKLDYFMYTRVSTGWIKNVFYPAAVPSLKLATFSTTAVVLASASLSETSCYKSLAESEQAAALLA